MSQDEEGPPAGAMSSAAPTTPAAHHDTPATSNTNAVSGIREYEPLTQMLELLPKQTAKGIFGTPIAYTCIDATSEYIALGTNVGQVMLYDRVALSLHRLICKHKATVITCIRIQQGVDYVVAAGTSSGVLIIFQLPSYLPGRTRQLQLFIVEELHSESVTALAWSPNASRLFSGDCTGAIVCTEIDYPKSQSRSYVLSQEPHPVVQLDYAHKTLLISTTFRAVLLLVEENNRKVQMGTKDRKVLGDYGACFLPEMNPHQVCIYATRPGLRVWKANMEGGVMATFIFKDLLNGTTPIIPTLQGTENTTNAVRISEKNFGRLLMLESKVLVTWHEGAIFLLDSDKGQFIGWHDNLGHILDVTVCENEIYVLRRAGTRKIVRIASKKDPLIERMSEGSSPPPEDQCVSIEETMAAALMREEQGHKASPLLSLTERASQMSKDLKAAFKTLKSPLVPETVEPPLPTPHLRPDPPVVLPPWGQAPPLRDIDDLDPCQEVDSSSSLVSSPVSPAHSANPAGVPSTDAQSTTQPTNIPVILTDNVEVKRRTSSKSSINSDLTSKHSSFSESTEDSGVHIPFSHSQSLQDAQDLNQLMTTSNVSHTSFESVAVLGSEKFDDIVFASKQKKHKKKKHKAGSWKDKDSDSIVSSDSIPPIKDLTAGLAAEDPAAGTNPHIPSAAELFPAGQSLSPLIVGDHNSASTDDTDTADDLESKPIVPELGRQRSNSGMDNFIDRLLEDNREKLKQEDDKSSQKTAGLSRSQSEQVVVCSVDLNGVEAHPFDENPPSAAPSASLSPEILDEPALDPFKISPSHASAISSMVQSGAMKVSHSMPAGIGQLEEDGEKRAASPEVDIYSSTPVPSAMPLSKAAPGTPHLQLDTPLSPSSSQSADSPSDGDFYSQYLSNTQLSSPTESEPSIEDALDYKRVVEEGLPEVKETRVEMSAGMDAEEHLQKYAANTWTEFMVPGNVNSLAVSQHHVWITDRSYGLHYSSLAGPGLKWHKVEGFAKTVSVSPTGGILWRVYKKQAFAAINISLRNPAGLKWVLAAPEVSYVSVDDHVAWYVKVNGDVMMQKKLSRDRPCFRAYHIACPSLCIQVSSRNNVTWVLTEYRQILVRVGISTANPEGTDWVPLDGTEANEILVSHFTLGAQGTVWVMDVVGRVWFRTGVTQDKPRGNKGWWQVSSSEYLMQDSTALGMLKSLMEVPQKMAKMSSGGLVAATQQGIWLCPDFKHILHVCRGSLLGHRWLRAAPGGMAASAKWTRVSAMAASSAEGLIWAQQPNNAIFCFPPDCSRPIEIPIPGVQSQFQCLCAAPGAIWGLLDSGRVCIRTGLGPHCPQGVRWEELDLTQLGGAKLLHISCGFNNVWAVDNKGMVYLRIGIKAPLRNEMSPAWVPVDGSTHHAGGKFLKVITGPMDWMVWAVDNKNCVYARRGITDSMPIGTHWVYIQGTPAKDLCVSSHFAYALNLTGEVLVRYGICPDNCTGDYWKKIPGAFEVISVTPEDDMWGINQEGQLSYRMTHYIKRQPVMSRLGQGNRKSIGEDWELL